jgi:Anti-sigma factor NepR
MKALKSVRPPLGGEHPQTEGRPEGPEAPMQTDAPIRRTAGRLSREDQRRLGDILQRVYDEVVHQGVPDRFKVLLDELNEPSENSQAQSSRPLESAEDPESDRRLEGKGASAQGSKGQH